MNAKLAVCIVAAGLMVGTPAGATEPSGSRLAAYVHLNHCVDEAALPAHREEQLEQLVAAMRDAGIQSIVPYVSTTSGVAHYPTERLPERRWGDWDPVGVLMQAARRHGLQVVLCVPVLACGHDEPSGILREHPEWALRNTAGQPIGSISPGHPEARRWVVEWLAELVDRYQPDGVLLDYLRYSSQETQLDERSAARLNELLASQPESNPSELNQAAREQMLTELMEMISTRLRQLQPRLQIAIYSWGYHVTDNHRVAQAWPVWAARGYIDEVNVSGYWYPKSFSRRFGDSYTAAFDNALQGARSLLDESGSDTRLTFALGVKTSHGQVDSAEDIERYLQLAQAAGVDGAIFFTWSYLQPFLPQLVQSDVLHDFAGPRSLDEAESPSADPGQAQP